MLGKGLKALKLVNGRPYSRMTPRQKELYDWVELQPKVDLHRHLEGAIPYRTLHKFYKHNATAANMQHFKPSYSSVEELREAVSLTTPMLDLKEVLDRLDVFQHAFVSVNATREITIAAILSAFQEESICKVEFRFSPHYMAEPANLNWDKMMEAMVEAKEACMKTLGPNRLQVGFVAIASRNYGQQSAIETVEFAERWREHIVGFDLAASEDWFPPETFLPAINRCKDLGLPITVHSGEGTTPEHIRQVVELYKPQRLGHATALIEDRKLMDTIRDLQICVEACPTSNIITNSVKAYKEHPLLKYLEHGIPVCVNTDDPMLFGTDLRREWVHVMEHLNATPEQMVTMNELAHRHSFIKDENL